MVRGHFRRKNAHLALRRTPARNLICRRIRHQCHCWNGADFENRLLSVRQGKGRKDRQIPLVDEEVKALRNYLRHRATELILDDDTLFLAKNGTSLILLCHEIIPIWCG